MHVCVRHHAQRVIAGELSGDDLYTESCSIGVVVHPGGCCTTGFFFGCTQLYVPLSCNIQDPVIPVLCEIQAVKNR